MRHVINKLTFELACANEQQAFKMRETVLRDMYEEIVSVIEMCCDRISGDEQLVQIEKLEINLQAFRDKFFDKKQYIRLFETAFAEALSRNISSPVTGRTVQASHADILRCFLETGVLPWWTDDKEVDLKSWCVEITQGAEADNFITWLLDHKQVYAIWHRISGQLPSSFGDWVVGHIPGLAAVQDRIRVLYEKLVNTLGTALIVTENESEAIGGIVLENAVQLLSKDPVADTALLSRLLVAVLPESAMQQLPQEYQNAIAQERVKIAVPGVISPDENEAAHPANQEEKIMTGHAGIILLTAFLTTFFSNLQLWRENSWASDDARCKAVCLLFYLATGAEPEFEYQLVLEKIICGMPVHAPLKRLIMPAEEEKREADDLLASAVQHWTALKNTSVNGLRHAFLQRQGLLSRQQNNWLLQVERKAMDILLEQLPWGYATVTLPWNKYLIYTEW